MRRGEIWWVNFEPARGGEIRKQRPAIIVSNDIANRLLNRVQVVPLTSSVERLYPSEALILVNGTPNKALADQLTTVSKTRLSNYVDTITEDELLRLEEAIKIQLDLRR
jgi:mRNA interferase MazF